MKQNTLIAIAGVLAVAVILLVLVGPGTVLDSASKKSLSAQGEPLTIGMEPNQVNSLILIADELGYFNANGLCVTFRNYPSGAAAVAGLADGDSDIAMAAEFVLVGKALSHTPVRTLGSIDRFQQIYVVGQRDRGIEQIPDLRGKRIGVPQKTAGEFYLGRFLLLHDIDMRDVILVNVPPQQSADAIANGSVDAVVAWQPHVKTIEGRLMNGTVKWPAQSSQPAYCIAIATDTWISTHPGTIDRFLTAIRQSEEYTISHPAEAREIARKRLLYDDAFIMAIWPEHQFSLTFDQSLVIAMEDEARWMIANNLSNVTNVPDFRQYMYTDGLLQVKPGSVNIIR